MPSLYDDIKLPTGIIYSIASAGTGQIVVTYTYDTWGNCEVQELSGYAIGDLNPFRYRGYYWDSESGLYYLNSRYYTSLSNETFS